jgi:nitroreductase
VYHHPYPSPELRAAHPFRRLDFERLEAAVMRQRGEEFHELMERRRSVRMFSPDPVPRELVELAIRTAATAPSGAHRQPWTFVVTGDPATKRAVREAAEAEERRNYEEGRINDEWRSALAPLGTDWHKEFLEIAPWLVVVFEQRYGLGADGFRIQHYYVKESVGIAVGLFVAALHTMGLATLPHTPSPMAFLSRVLGRPENERPFALFPIGYPLEGVEVPDLQRKSLDEVLAVVEEPAGGDRRDRGEDQESAG